mmetsp:Transcript_9995/g.24906  ORF Transcript_9995/g.24906 Transcript_9995/m.24906 type:complete len:507 (+) Transcript_9995:338-1858(+)
MAHGLSRRDAVLGRVLEHLLQQIDRFRRGLVLQVLWQRAPLHLRKFHLLVVRVHQVDLLLCRRSQNFDDLDQLVHPRLSGEEGPSDDHFRHHAAHGPHVDGRRVRRRPENQLWSPVVPRANVSNVLLPLHKLLRRPKVAQLAFPVHGIHQDVLRLDVPVADVPRVDISQRPQQLKRVELHHRDRHVYLVCRLVHVALRGLEQAVWHVLEDHVKVHVLVRGCAEVVVLKLDNVGVLYMPHDLQLPVFEPPVLVYFFDGDDLLQIEVPRLINDPKASLADDLVRGKGAHLVERFVAALPHAAAQAGRHHVVPELRGGGVAVTAGAAERVVPAPVRLVLLLMARQVLLNQLLRGRAPRPRQELRVPNDYVLHVLLDLGSEKLALLNVVLAVFVDDAQAAQPRAHAGRRGLVLARLPLERPARLLRLRELLLVAPLDLILARNVDASVLPQPLDGRVVLRLLLGVKHGRPRVTPSRSRSNKHATPALKAALLKSRSAVPPPNKNGQEKKV